MGFWIFVFAALAIWLIVLSVKAKKKRRQKGLEEAILQAHRTGNWEIVDNYCVRENISDAALKKTEKSVMLSLGEGGDLEAMRSLVTSAETAEERCRWLTKLSEAGDARSMYRLALGYSEAINAKSSVDSFGEDPEKEFYWYCKAADKGYDKAMAAVAGCYYFGTGVPKDKKKAFDYAKDCANRGSSACCFFLVDNFGFQFDNPHITTAERIKMMERVMLRGEPESFAKAAWKLGFAYGEAYLYDKPENEYSDRRKAAYCFVLAYVLDKDLYDKDKIIKTGYRATQYELNKWQEDARNLRYNPA